VSKLDIFITFVLLLLLAAAICSLILAAGTAVQQQTQHFIQSVQSISEGKVTP